MEPLLMRIVFSREFPELGQRIKELRQQSKKSLAQLAAEAGISVPHWNRIENEKVQDLPIETLRGVEKALEVDLGVNLGDVP
jgi:transcriptional regulator with XRE-family HTH domain